MIAASKRASAYLQLYLSELIKTSAILMIKFLEIPTKRIFAVLIAIMTALILFGIFSFAPPSRVSAQGAPCTTEDGRPGFIGNGGACVASNAGVEGSACTENGIGGVIINGVCRTSGNTGWLDVFGSIPSNVAADTKAVVFGASCSTLNLLSYINVFCYVTWINHIIGFLFGFLIMLVMMVMEYSLYLNSKVMLLPAVQIGWNFTRDVANMGFVLGIIIIAFATILRSQTYGVKQLIVKLIVAAVFVNLSLSIAGVFLDFAGVPTQYFIDKISGGAGGPLVFSSTLADAFHIQNITQFNETLKDDKDKLGLVGTPTVALASVFFSVIFSFVILVTLIAMTSMFLYRFIALAILIIMMPLAILSWVFPAIRSRWNQWMQTFIKWTFFAPISLFFLYLAIYTVKVQGNYITQAASDLKSVPLGPAQTIGQNLAIGTNDPVLLIANMVLMVLLALGGLFAAQQMSIAGASAAMNFATSGAKGILRSSAGAVGGMAGRAALRAGAKPETGTPSYAQRTATALASVPVLRGLAKYVGQAEKSREKRVDDIQKGEMANLSNNSLEAFLHSRTIFTNLERASAAFAEAAKRKVKSKVKDENGVEHDVEIGMVSKLQNEDQGQYKNFMDAARRTGTLSNISKFKPEAAEPTGVVEASAGETPAETTARAKFEAVQKVMRTMSGRKLAEDVDINSFGDTNVVLSIESNQLKGLDEFASPDKIKAFMGTLDKLEADKSSGRLSKPMESRLDELLDAIRERSLFQRYAKAPTPAAAPTTGPNPVLYDAYGRPINP